MERVTVSLDEDAAALVEQNVGDGSQYESKSEFVRRCIQQYERVESLQERVDDLEAELEAVRDDRDQLQERADRADDLEREIERLKNEKQTLIQQREENKELVAYVEEERSVEQQWREAGLWTTAKWKLLGMPSDESTA